MIIETGLYLGGGLAGWNYNGGWIIQPLKEFVIYA